MTCFFYYESDSVFGRIVATLIWSVFPILTHDLLFDFIVRFTWYTFLEAKLYLFPLSCFLTFFLNIDTSCFHIGFLKLF